MVIWTIRQSKTVHQLVSTFPNLEFKAIIVILTFNLCKMEAYDTMIHRISRLHSQLALIYATSGLRFLLFLIWIIRPSRINRSVDHHEHSSEFEQDAQNKNWNNFHAFSIACNLEIEFSYSSNSSFYHHLECYSAEPLLPKIYKLEQSCTSKVLRVIVLRLLNLHNELCFIIIDASYLV